MDAMKPKLNRNFFDKSSFLCGKKWKVLSFLSEFICFPLNNDQNRVLCVTNLLDSKAIVSNRKQKKKLSEKYTLSIRNA